MSSVATAHRIEKLAGVMQDEGIDAYLAHSPITMGYLHGVWEGAHERFMTLAVRSTGEVRCIAPALSEQQLLRAGVIEPRVWRDGEDPIRLFQQLASDWNLRSTIIAVDDELPAKMLLEMQGVLPAALFKPGQALLSSLMRFKDAEEIRLMKEAASIADRALAYAIEAIKPGVTERDVEGAINRAMETLGGKPTFCIVAAGANGAEPHHLTDSTVIRSGDVIVLDYGCSVDGYQSDITRVVCCGQAPDGAKEVYRIVLEAHRAGRIAAKQGASCGLVDTEARKVIEQAGYGEFFPHRTGHGIGLNGHEEPYIVGGSEMQLQRGDCFSIEPGIYLPGKFGVRIENIITIAQGGPGVSLNEEPSDELIEIG